MVSHEAGDLRQPLETLVSRHEAPRARPGEVSVAPGDYIVQQMKVIIGFEITIDRIEGKWKMSQNHGAADIDGVIEGLGSSPDPQDRSVAGIVAAKRPKNP